jgi:hypothetical protein
VPNFFGHKDFTFYFSCSKMGKMLKQEHYKHRILVFQLYPNTPQ